jgi:hypothetical protein
MAPALNTGTSPDTFTACDSMLFSTFLHLAYNARNKAGKHEYNPFHVALKYHYRPFVYHQYNAG